MASRVPVGDSAAAQQTYVKGAHTHAHATLCTYQLGLSTLLPLCSGAFHGPSYGLAAELKDKMDSKYDVAQEQSIRYRLPPRKLEL